MPEHPEIRTSDGVVASLPSAEVREDRAVSYAEWIERIARPQPHGHDAVPTQCEPVHWTPLAKPLAECTVALVSTGGVHRQSQEPFAVYDEAGDWSSRQIPGDVDTSELTVTHTHYATQDALDDINVMFPIDRLRELAAEGIVGQVSSRHYGFMGFIPDPRLLVEDVLPGVAKDLRDHDVDAVMLTAG